MKNFYFFQRFGNYFLRKYKHYFSKKGKLLNKLIRENKECKKKYVPIKGKQDFLVKENFKLIEKENSLLISLEKKIENYDLKITFHSKPIQQIISLNKEFKIYNFCRFYILLKSLFSTSGLFIIAINNSSKISIERIVFNHNIEQFYQSYFGTTLNNEYLGPEIESLDEDLIKSFEEFIETAINVDNDLCSFIELMAYDRDQILYISWINKVINILN